VNPNTRDFFVDVRQQLLEMARNPDGGDNDSGAPAAPHCSGLDTGAYIARASQLVSDADTSMSVRTLAADVRAELVWLETSATATERPGTYRARPDDVTFLLEDLISAIDCALDCDA
jgi:hypothetical protein